MKNFKKLCALVLLGGATLVTSCVTEEISPEVEKLRQAQVSYLQAKAEMEQAQADAAAVQTALLQLQLDYQKAVQESEISGAIADIEAQIFAAQQRAAAAELALQKAIDNLSGHINDMAAEYLASYKQATGEANAKLSEIINQEGKLARLSAYLDENGNPISFDLMAEQIQMSLAQDSAQYKAQESSLAVLISVDADPTSAEAELNDVVKQLEELKQALDKKIMETEDAYLARENAYSELFEARDLISSTELQMENLETFKDQVENLKGYIAQTESEIASLENQLAPYEAELAERTAVYEPALATAEELLTAWIEAEAAYKAAAVNNAPGDEAYDSALAARDAARTDFEAHAGDYYAEYGISSPDDIYLEYQDGIAGTTFGDAKIAFDKIEIKFAAGNEAGQLVTELEYGQNQLENLQNALESYQHQVASIEAQLQSTEAAYAAALENIEDLKTASIEARVNFETQQRALFDLQEQYSNMQDVKWNLESYLNGAIADLANEIEYLEQSMITTKFNIAQHLAALEDNAISKEEWAKVIAQEEKKLETLNGEYEALLAMAAEYLELFNEAVAN